jgi:predicted aconitase
LNPQSFSPEYMRDKLPEQIVERQLSILEQFERMHFTESLTCTPYYLQKPKPDLHLAWAESSAVVYANSVLRAWTNREGGPSALAAAIIGKTPDYGMHRAENRKPNVTVRVEKPLKDETEFGSLGIYLGKILADRIPAIQGLERASEVNLKQLGAALGTTGMVNMFHSESRVERTGTEKITIQPKDLDETRDELSTAPHSKPDLVFIGCPHCSISELRQIQQLVEGKKVKAGIECWICTSRHNKAQESKLVSRIEKSGIHVLADMCTVVSWTEKFGIETIMTNSAKTAYYAPTLNKAKTILAPQKDCLKAAFKG